jgi:uncharacterized protein YdeI (YjbR/CyaY-like superfamily)
MSETPLMTRAQDAWVDARDRRSPEAAVISCVDADAWESWLLTHHEAQDGVWLKIAKKGSGERSVTSKDALEVALCYGWIDSRRKALDEKFFLQKYSPRRRGSSWSRINAERAEALIAAGRMHAAGLAQIDGAKADGRWDAAYESQRAATIPADLAAALATDESARAHFESLGRTDRYAVILPLLKARTAASREAQLSRIVALLRVGRRVT